MSGTEPTHDAGGRESAFSVDPGTAAGYGRILLFGGMGWLALGSFLDVAIVFWGGLGIVGLAFACNTAAKLVHYRELDVPPWHRVALAASWLSLTGTVLALLGVYAAARYGDGSGEFFWSFAVAGVGFGLLHMAAQSRLLPADARLDGD